MKFMNFQRRAEWQESVKLILFLSCYGIATKYVNHYGKANRPVFVLSYNRIRLRVVLRTEDIPDRNLLRMLRDLIESVSLRISDSGDKLPESLSRIPLRRISALFRVLSR